MPTCISHAAPTQMLRHHPPNNATGAANSIATAPAASGGKIHAWRTATSASGEGVPPSRSSLAAE